jgi:hypothetical protein
MWLPIIHSASFGALKEKLPDPSNKVFGTFAHDT